MKHEKRRRTRLRDPPLPAKSGQCTAETVFVRAVPVSRLTHELLADGP